MMTHVIVFVNDTAATEIYTLSLHDALPICDRPAAARHRTGPDRRHRRPGPAGRRRHARGLDGDGRPGRGGQDGEQGPRVPTAAHPHRLTTSWTRVGSRRDGRGGASPGPVGPTRGGPLLLGAAAT